MFTEPLARWHVFGLRRVSYYFEFITKSKKEVLSQWYLSKVTFDVSEQYNSSTDG